MDPIGRGAARCVSRDDHADHPTRGIARLGRVLNLWRGSCYHHDTTAGLATGVVLVPPATSTRSLPTTETPPRRELRGVVERITFQNPENGFTVARLAPERRDSDTISSLDDERLITLVGTLP